MKCGADDFSCGSVITFAAIYGHHDKKIALEAVPYLYAMIAIPHDDRHSADDGLGRPPMLRLLSWRVGSHWGKYPGGSGG